MHASKLWFDKLICFLRSEGYEQSPTDPCVMRKIVNSKVFLLLIYVDNIHIFAERCEIERLRQRFMEEFTWITIEIGKKHSYLGMEIYLFGRRVCDD